MAQMIETYCQKKMNKSILVLIMMWCCGGILVAQVDTQVDTTTIKIGEELILTFEVETDSTSTVVFPEGQTFQPLELLESYAADTTKQDLKIKLIKKYGLTQFDSGVYRIPRQKILINDTILFSDSIAVQVNSVKVDTTKQKLYDIKPIIGVEKQRSGWGWFWWILGIGLIAVLLIFKLIWAKKTTHGNETEKNLPPYEHAKAALKALDEKHYFENNKIKSFYSELTLVLRRYLDEKVYGQSLESTTDELLEALHGLKKAKTIRLNDESLKNIEAILKRADLVKFAKSKPNFEIIRLDKNTIDSEIDQVKKGLPEPTEEELQMDLKYQEQLQRKKRQRQLKIAGISAAGLVLLTFIGSSLYFGFSTVKDTLLRHPSKLLLETEHWVSSEYGAPGITIETPEVLGRKSNDSVPPSRNNASTKIFGFFDENVPLKILIKSSKYPSNKDANQPQKEPIDLLNAAEKELDELGRLGGLNMLPRNEKFTTQNGQEGLKTYGSAMFPFEGSNAVSAEFVILGFSTADLLQQLIMVWATDDDYTKAISDRILSSVELIKSNQN